MADPTLPPNTPADEVNAVEAELLKAFTEQEHKYVPGWEIPMIPPAIIPALAKAGAVVAIATLEDYRTKHLRP